MVLRNEPERLEKLSIAALNVSVTAENASPVHIMHYAAALGAVDCLAVLILRLKGSPGVPRQLHCCDSRFPFGDRQGVLRLLIQSEFEVDFGHLLESAASFGDAVFAEHLLSEFGDASESHVHEAMRAASLNGHPECLEVLLEHELDMDAHSWGDEMTPLMAASRAGTSACVKVLLEWGEDVNATDEDCCTAVMYASMNNHAECLRLLLEADCYVVDLATRGNGVTPLICAAQNGCVDSVRLLLEHGADATKPNGEWETPVMLAARCCRPECVRLLLEHGADAKSGGGCGGSPLQYALSSRGFFRRVKGAMVEDAAENARAECLRHLLEHGADANQQTMNRGFSLRRFMSFSTPLLTVCRDQNYAAARLLLEHGAKVNAKDSDGFTSLMIVADWGNVEIVTLLLEHGADVNLGKEGSTALIFSILKGQVACARLLLEHGADLNVVNTQRVTAIFYAASHGLFDCAKLLLDHGAEIQAHVLAAAASKGHTDCVRLLLEHGADVGRKGTIKNESA